MTGSLVVVLVVVLVVAASAVGTWTGRAQRDAKHDLRWCRDQLADGLPAPVDVGVGQTAVPCPYCGLVLNHTGECRLSRMRSGKVLTVWASTSFDERLQRRMMSASGMWAGSASQPAHVALAEIAESQS